jgi:hypothetical protein
MSIHQLDAPSVADLSAMVDWTTAIYRLLDHAVKRTSDVTIHVRLDAAREDAELLRRELFAAADGHRSIDRVEELHSIYLLWEANQDRHEALAADVDPGWHVAWRARTAMVRLRRKGALVNHGMALHYA